MLSAQTVEFLGVIDAAKFLNLTKGSLYNLVSRGVIPHYKPTGKILFKKSELLDFIEAGRIPSNSEIEAEAAIHSARK